MRRLPVYFLLDTSGSMYGEPIEALNNALSGMINQLRSDPQAAETLWISIITFDRSIRELMPLTPLETFVLPSIVCPESGPTFTGRALEVLYHKVKQDIRKTTPDQKGDWLPLLFLFTDGKPSDVQLYQDMTRKMGELNFGTIVACAAGPRADHTTLLALTPHVVQLDTTDSSTLKQFFTWVSDAIENGNKSQGVSDEVELPPPPAAIHLVI